jgi:hypothetical protein
MLRSNIKMKALKSRQVNITIKSMMTLIKSIFSIKTLNNFKAKSNQLSKEGK